MTGPIEIRANALGWMEQWLTLDFGHYPAGEPYVKALPADVERGFDLLVRTADIGVLNEALMFVDAMKWRHGDITVDLHLPHFPGARQDRLNPEGDLLFPEGDLLFTAKSVANMINQRGFRSVWVVDPHSDVIPALVDNVRVVTALDCLKVGFGEDEVPYHGVIAPDAGAEKRALLAAKWLGVPLHRAWKNRDVATGKITGFGCEPLADGYRYLIVDDLCDGGGTFLGLAGAITEDVTLDLYVSHGVFSKGVEDLGSAFVDIFATDSLGSVPDGVYKISVATQLKETQQ